MENSLTWWLGAMFIPTITMFGVIGNILTVIVLSRKPQRRHFRPESYPMISMSSRLHRSSSSSTDPYAPQECPSSTRSDTQCSTSNGRHQSPVSQPSSSSPDDGTYLPPLTTRFLLKALAVVDSFILLWPCFIQWTVRLSSGSSIFDRLDTFCKIGTFFNYFLLQLSPWLLVLVTIDRVYNIAFPTFSLKTPLTQTHVKRLFIVTMLILALLNSYMLFGLNLRLEKEMSNTPYENATNASSPQSDWKCYPKDSFKYFVISVWSWIDFAVAFGLPCGIIVLGNVLVFRKMKSSENFRSRYAHGGIIASEKWAKVSAILGISFIVLVMPLVVFQIGGEYWFTGNPDLELKQTFDTLRLVFTLLLYTNSAINFVMYMLLGSPKLRQQFVKPLHDCKKIICKCTSTDE
ncbi:uncharacterized protein LOC128224577 [Mya arenaria]|uniref:uncharacterized protein LOC128224577 n=1 Tax=Mya arenaria TaxID=6604 RepID=UPI0022E1E9EF|nr:uncharacterized protein LOC128224577 [Mya arenaria]XP_052790443.1 uncharacterized protein LOC128224577 [Mya arenaria]